LKHGGPLKKRRRDWRDSGQKLWGEKGLGNKGRNIAMENLDEWETSSHRKLGLDPSAVDGKGKKGDSIRD